MDQNPFSSPEGYDSPGSQASYGHGGGYADHGYTEQDYRDANNWALALHLSQFAGYLIPFGGFLVPILIWQLKKGRYPILDEHGREVVNWIISELIYGLLFAVLTIVVIGIPLLIVLGVVSVVFPIIAAIKASDGRLWRYPGNIRFL